MKTLVLALFSALLFPSAWSQDAEPQELLTQQSLNLQNRLAELRQQSVNLTNELMELQQNYQRATLDLKTQSTTVAELQNQLTLLSENLENINQQLSDSYRKLTIYEQRLKTRSRVIMILGVIILIRLVGMVGALVCYFKGIKLPRIVDILL